MSDPTPGTISPHFTRGETAERYRDIQLPRIFEPWARVLLETVPVAPGQSVLDVATGPGTVARPAARLSGPTGRVTAVDISAAMLGVARSFAPEAGAAAIEYLQSSASAMPLPDGSFDVAFCQQGLQHMADPFASLREMHRLLKPGGRIGLAIWTESPFGLFRQVVAGLALASAGTRPSEFGRDAGQVVAALGEIGFHDVQVQHRDLVTPLPTVDQALQTAEGTSLGSVLATLSDAERQTVRAALTEALQPYVKEDGAVHLRSGANITLARR